jgi:hypothetical protein
MGASPSKRIQPGNIQEGNSTVVGEIPLANSSSRRSSTITLNPSQKTSSNVRFVPPTNGILRTARPSPPRLQTITPISPIRSRSSSLTSLPNPPLSRTASPVSISNSNYHNNSTGVIEGGFRRRRANHTNKRKRIHRTHKNRKPKRGTRHRK